MSQTQVIKEQAYFAERALLMGDWAENVRIEVRNGLIYKVESNATSQLDDIRLTGPVLPTIANLHSHAFQRLMAGVAEVSKNPNDSFWSWRELMYKLVRKLTPDDVRVIATQLYIDMLKAGYTQVAEFHYLHHSHDGSPYHQPAEMALQLLQAADDVGIGVTLLPALYSYSGFGVKPPNAGQARFVQSTDAYLNLHHQCQNAIDADSLHKLGICFHSLRAVSKTQIEQVLASTNKAMPIHIHISEQQKEIDDSLAWCGQRPVQWLNNEIELNDRWCLVHATHLEQSELQAIAKSGAVVGLCPTTEANLGDGIFPGVAFEEANGRWGVGSDSHVSLSIAEELKTLEYSQRLRDQQRNRLYSGAQNYVGDHLFDRALTGGNQACDVSFGLAVGNRADFMVLDELHPFIAASQPQDIINRWVFACNENVVKDVFVGGQPVVVNFRHVKEQASRQAFAQVIKKVMYDV